MRLQYKRNVSRRRLAGALFLNSEERLRVHRWQTQVRESVTVGIKPDASAHSIARAKHEGLLAERRVSECT